MRDMSSAINLKECLFKELEIVEDIINRMANNSFLIKGWAVTLVIISFLIDGMRYHHFLALIPWLVFWYLDASFLRLERCYKELYDWLIKNRLTSDEKLFNMNAKARFKNNVGGIPQTMVSWSLLSFYGMIFVLIVSVLVFEYVIIK